MKNIVICSDPESKYAKRAMDILDKKMTTTPTICYYTSTTNTIPAVTTTNKTPGKKTETSTNTTASRIVMTIETSRPETEASTGMYVLKYNFKTICVHICIFTY